MSDFMQIQPSHAAEEEEKKLVSARYGAFCEALDALYIAGNLSGRLHFAREWPAAATRIFGEALEGYDREGAISPEDKEHRASLEKEAEARRAALWEAVRDLRQNSVDGGVLQMAHIESVIRDLGREIALYLYAAPLVDRFAPPPVAETSPEPSPDLPPESSSAPPQKKPETGKIISGKINFSGKVKKPPQT